MNPFRRRHAHYILDNASDTLPLDVQLRDYFKKNTAIGSKDRKWIAQTIYGLKRWEKLATFVQTTKGISDPIDSYLFLEERGFNIPAPDDIAISFPKELFARFTKHYGKKQAKEICRVLNEEAPVTIRSNPIKISRKELVERLQDFNPQITKESPFGIRFAQRANFFGMPEFKAGFFEMQDEASQLAAQLIEAKPGDCVLDYCSGSGGKSLAFAHKLQGKGQLYLHDVRMKALLEAKKRMKRAGIQNYQTVDTKTLKKPRFISKMDWILLDVPCSGTGTLRRNPDMKWRIDDAAIEELVVKQREIVKKALPLLAPEGKLVYATCSILPEENEEQIAYFEKAFNLIPVGKPFVSLPRSGEKDGFFALVMQKKDTYSNCA